MREILFRGKDSDGKWNYGFPYLIRCKDVKGWVILADIESHEEITELDVDKALCFGLLEVTPVQEETVGQFTGHTDIKGNKIFEGDILSVEYHNEPIVVAWEVFDTEQGFNLMLDFDMEVIGNIHDNPELLKGGTQ